MLRVLTFLYLMFSTSLVDAGIQVQGHIEMGESIAKFFNELVDQFQQNASMTRGAITNFPHLQPGHRDTRFDTIRLTEEFMNPPDPVVVVPETDDLYVPPVRPDVGYYNIPPVEEPMSEPSETPILSEMIRDPVLGVVHLYGHHRFNEVKSEPKNNVNI